MLKVIMIKKNYLFFIILILAIIPVVNALDNETTIYCGGDAELAIGCIGQEFEGAGGILTVTNVTNGTTDTTTTSGNNYIYIQGANYTEPYCTTDINNNTLFEAYIPFPDIYLGTNVPCGRIKVFKWLVGLKLTEKNELFLVGIAKLWWIMMILGIILGVNVYKYAKEKYKTKQLEAYPDLSQEYQQK